LGHRSQNQIRSVSHNLPTICLFNLSISLWYWNSREPPISFWVLSSFQPGSTTARLMIATVTTFDHQEAWRSRSPELGVMDCQCLVNGLIYCVYKHPHIYIHIIYIYMQYIYIYTHYVDLLPVKKHWKFQHVSTPPN
jgi:hypothetical protein